MSLLLNNFIFKTDEKKNVNNINLILEKELTEEEIEDEQSFICLYKTKQQFIDNKISTIKLSKKKKITILKKLTKIFLKKKNNKLLLLKKLNKIFFKKKNNKLLLKKKLNKIFLKKKNNKLLLKKNRKSRSKIVKTKPFKKKINRKKKLYQFKKNNNISYTDINTKYNNKYILYIIQLSILKKNTTICVTDTKGQLKLNYSASNSLKLSGKQKTFQPKVLIELLKFFLKKLYLLKLNKKAPIALHLKYIPKNYVLLIIKRLQQKFKIQTINYANFYPHNGCRPKKIRRLKRRKNQQNKKFYFKGRPFSSLQKSRKKNKFYENM